MIARVLSRLAALEAEKAACRLSARNCKHRTRDYGRNVDRSARWLGGGACDRGTGRKW